MKLWDVFGSDKSLLSTSVIKRISACENPGQDDVPLRETLFKIRPDSPGKYSAKATTILKKDRTNSERNKVDSKESDLRLQ